MTTICLNMIVKNESHIIEQTLENICQHLAISYWVIADTGSTDDTPERIRAFFAKKGIAGELLHHTWQNFGHNRELALKACAQKADYVFVFDADDYIDGQFPALEKLTQDCYQFKMLSESGSQMFQRVLLFRNDYGFHWRGALHEFLTNQRGYRSEVLEGDYRVMARSRGARSHNPNKYRDDAKLLEQVIEQGQDPELLPRYSFYCAQSYQSAGEKDLAIQWYKKRTTLSGWMQEVFISHTRLGLMYESLKRHADALMAWQAAVEVDPLRPEAWYHLARRHRWNKHYPLALCFAERAEQAIWPKHRVMFLNKDINTYWCYYEVCVSAFHLNQYAKSYRSFKALLRNAPSKDIQRVIHHLPFYQDLIQQDQFADVMQMITHLKEKGFEQAATQLQNVESKNED